MSEFNSRLEWKRDHPNFELKTFNRSHRIHFPKGADQEEDVLLFEMNQMSQESDCKNSEKGSNPGNQNFFQQDPRGTFPLPPHFHEKAAHPPPKYPLTESIRKKG